MFGNQQAAQGTLNTNYGAQNVATAPKELGFIQRIEGIRNGLDQIEERLRNLTARMVGGPNNERDPSPMPDGIPSNLSVSEDRIKTILNFLAGLEQAF